MLKILCFSVFLISPILAMADSLFLHSSLSLSRSTALWLKGDQKQDYIDDGNLPLSGGPEKATRNYYQLAISGTYFFKERFEAGLELQGGYVKLSNGPFLGAKTDQSQGQLSKVAATFGYTFYKEGNHSAASKLTFSYPGIDYRKDPEFLSFNDFSSYIDIILTSTSTFGRWEVSPLIKYRHLTAGPGNNHAAAELNTLYVYNSRLKVGLALDHLTTFGGRDVADDGFLEIVNASGRFPVWNKDESWVGAGLIGAYLLEGNWIADFYIHRKLWGENTDVATTFAVGIGKEIGL